MKLYTLLLKLTEIINVHHDKQVIIRISKRDVEGAVTHIKEIGISYLLTARIPVIAIEAEDIENQPWQEMTNNI